MQKILIIGNCGVGKTTFSRKLAKKLKLPLIHLDQHYWKPNWTKPTKEEWEDIVKKLVRGERWIMDGNYRSSFPLRIPAADTIIFLDFPKSLALWQVFTRFFSFIGKKRADIGGNNREKIDFTFIKWVATFPRQQVLEAIRRYQTTQKLVIMQTPQELEDFLATLPRKDSL